MIEWIADMVFRVFYMGCIVFLILASCLAAFLFFNDGDGGGSCV